MLNIDESQKHLCGVKDIRKKIRCTLWFSFDEILEKAKLSCNDKESIGGGLGWAGEEERVDQKGQIRISWDDGSIFSLDCCGCVVHLLVHLCAHLKWLHIIIPPKMIFKRVVEHCELPPKPCSRERPPWADGQRANVRVGNRQETCREHLCL